MNAVGLDLSPEVRAALADGRPVVALESTVIAHGLPFPDNLEVAREMVQAVRDGGAVPAVVAIAGKRIRVGLGDTAIERLAHGDAVAKVSRRDLAAVLARGEAGATTVAATMICAHRAGIRVLATGGIGGVHRAAGTALDISADLVELSRTPVAVVCSGAKSILDLAATLEALETLGVPVVGYRTDRFPAFHARDGGCDVPWSVADARAAARLLGRHFDLGLGGAVIANPISEAEAIDRHALDGWVEDAHRQAAAEGVGGAALTPFLLARLAELSEGRTLRANKALLVANAGIGAEIAVALRRDAR